MSSKLVWSMQRAEALQGLGAEWDALNRKRGALPILDSQTVRLLLREFGDGSEQLAVCRCGEEVAAMTIVGSRGRGKWETFQPGQSPLGAWLHAPQHPLQPLLASLVRALPGACLLFGITQQDPQLLARPEADGRLRTLDYIETSRVSVVSSFAEYWQARGSNLRQNLKKQRNRLARENVPTRLESIASPEEVGAAVDDFGRLESAGWKGGEGSAVHPENAQGRFYRGFFERLSASGEATVYRYFFGDRLVASDLCVHRNGTLIVLKTAFDETEKTFSPSLLMKEQVFERLFGSGEVRCIEFYGKVMEWHRRWTDEMRTMYHVNYYRWPWIAKLQSRRKAHVPT